MLLALSTSWRPRSEIQHKGKGSKSIWLSPYNEDPSICPVRTLGKYLDLTKEHVTGKFENTMFFITSPKLLGSKNSVHSTREVSFTKEFNSGVSIKDLMQQADWKTENTFKKYYFKLDNKIAYSSTSPIFRATNTPIIERTFGPENDRTRPPHPKGKIASFYMCYTLEKTNSSKGLWGSFYSIS
ncbi:hypothetical protein AYI70_g6343 [Smittium culicis]|uniref:Uncharacterized protein n=1 Tax=Smittium culicis TaxID=133412 RepID=A0A1R1XQD4_9FUNG|nr:hypothetical protein AYI70_g6343 [Smittium culicis]